MTVAPNFGIAGITQFNFASSATDADGDALTYSWEFADGQRGTGASTIHNYGDVFGTANARLTVTDGRGGSVSDLRPVTVGNLSGNWGGAIDRFAFSMSLQQDSLGNVTGTWTFVGTTIVGQLDPAAANRIDGNGRFTLRCKVTGGVGGLGISDFTLVDGTMQTNGTTLTGGVQGSGFGGQPFTLLRQ